MIRLDVAQAIQPADLDRLESLSYFIRAWIAKYPAAIAWGKHPFPFRTRPLSPMALMVLQGYPCGRVESRRVLHQKAS